MRRRAYQPKPDDRHRRIPEAEILDLLLLVSWAYEVEAGQRATARRAAAAALQRWIAQGLCFRSDAAGMRLFDPVEVINFMKWAGLTGADTYWEMHFVATHRRFVQEFGFGPNPGLGPGFLPPQRFRMTLQRSFDLRGFDDGATIRLRAPRPLLGSYHGTVDVTPLLPEGVTAQMALRDHCLELRTRVPAEGRITMGAEFLLTTSDPIERPEPLAVQEREIYLRKSEGLIQVTPRIAALAAELSSGAPSARCAVAAFWNHMMGTLCSGMVRYHDVPPDSPGDWVIDNGWYDCQLGAALLASLCRARGIPARIVSGHLLYRVQPISHYWCEVWLEDAGWRPFDVICWDLSCGGRDCDWVETFAGRIDYRIVTQCFPFAFTGPMTVRFPKAWQMMQRAAGPGVTISYTNADDGSLIYRDQVTVARLAAPAREADRSRHGATVDSRAPASTELEESLLL